MTGGGVAAATGVDMGACSGTGTTVSGDAPTSTDFSSGAGADAGTPPAGPTASGVAACAAAEPDAAVSPREAPHCSQKVLFGSLAVPQFGQVTLPSVVVDAAATVGIASLAAVGSGGCNGAPQFSQNAVPGRFSWPQVGHATLPVPVVSVVMAGLGAATAGVGAALRGAPHWSQKRFPSSLTCPFGQVIGMHILLTALGVSKLQTAMIAWHSIRFVALLGRQECGCCCGIGGCRRDDDGGQVISSTARVGKGDQLIARFLRGRRVADDAGQVGV